MLKEKEIYCVLEPLVYQSEPGKPALTLDICEQKLQDLAVLYGVPLEIKREQIKKGGLLNKEIEDCLELIHPAHRRDYYHLIIRLGNNGFNQTIQLDGYGRSKQDEKHQIAENRSLAGKEMWQSGASLSEKIGFSLGNKVFGAIQTLGKNKTKYEEENYWYQKIGELVAHL